MESATVERPRSLAVFQVVNVYLDVMRAFIREHGCDGREGLDAEIHLTDALPSLMQENYRKQVQHVQDPFIALDVNHIFLIIRRDWNAHFHQFFRDDDAFLRKMRDLNVVRNVVMHPNQSDLDERRTSKTFASVSSIFKCLDLRSAVKRVGLIEDRCRRLVEASDGNPPTDESPEEKLDRILDENWELRQQVEQLTAKLEGRSSAISAAFSRVIEFFNLSRFRGSSESASER